MNSEPARKGLRVAADELARRLRAENTGLIELLKGVSDDDWLGLIPDGEQRAIGNIALHVAWAHRHISRRVEAFARRLPVPPRQPHMFDERNARHAAANPKPDRSETISLLDQEGEVAARIIETLSADELGTISREDPGISVMSTLEVIEQRQIAHVASHRASIAAALTHRRPAPEQTRHGKA
jgi:hypothetical protein